MALSHKQRFRRCKKCTKFCLPNALCHQQFTPFFVVALVVVLSTIVTLLLSWSKASVCGTFVREYSIFGTFVLVLYCFACVWNLSRIYLLTATNVIMVCVLGFTGIAYGIFGAVIVTHDKSCLDSAPVLFWFDVFMFCFLLLASLPFVLWILYEGILDLTPTDEEAPILGCIRCSYFSTKCKQSVAVGIFFGISVSGFVIVAKAWKETCTSEPLHEFVLGSAILLFVYMLVILWSCCQRQRNHTFNSILMFFTFLVGTVWAILGSVWISHSSDCIETHPQLFSVAVILKIILLVVSIPMLCFVSCCRVEKSFQELNEVQAHEVQYNRRDLEMIQL